jgi:hypothetical protein
MHESYNSFAACATVRGQCVVQYTGKQRLLHYPHTHLNIYGELIVPLFEGAEMCGAPELPVREYMYTGYV